MKTTLLAVALIFLLFFAHGNLECIWWAAFLIGYAVTIYLCYCCLINYYKEHVLIEKINKYNFTSHLGFVIHGVVWTAAYGAAINKVGTDIGLSAKDFPATVALLTIPMSILVYVGFGIVALSITSAISIIITLVKNLALFVNGCAPTKPALTPIATGVYALTFAAICFGFHARFIAIVLGNERHTLKIAYELDYQEMHNFPGVSHKRTVGGKVCLHGDDYYSVMTPDLKIRFEKIVSIEEIKSKGYIE